MLQLYPIWRKLYVIYIRTYMYVIFIYIYRERGREKTYIRMNTFLYEFFKNKFQTKQH